jgi:predicted dehydrogenase
MDPLSSAVIGTGVISERHLGFLRDTESARLVAVCDLSNAAVRYAGARFGADAVFTDHRRMLDEARPDVVHVLTPPQAHAELAAECLEAGAHVIVEKPITLSHAEFQSLWKVAERVNKRLVESQNYRFNPPALALDQIVREGRIGEVRDVDVRMQLAVRAEGGRFADRNFPHPSHRIPAGIIHEFVSHLAYLALQHLPSFDRVAAAWSNHGAVSQDDVFTFDDLDALVIGGPVHAHLRFSAHAQPDCFALSIRGSEGVAETDFFHPFLRCTIPRRVGPQLSPIVNYCLEGTAMLRAGLATFSRKLLQKTPYEGLDRFLDLTYRALATGSEPPVTFDDMNDVSLLIEQMLAERNRV